ncbi:MAG: ATP-dependent DNA helicase [Candidatus Altiarchaeota archaeon]
MKYFPHPTVRSGQDEFIRDCERTLRNGGILAAHAPAGIGKTAAVLSASVEHALEKNKTIFFLTPKHTQHTIVVDTIRRMKERHNLNVRLVDIIGKQWMCPHKVRDLSSREFNEFCRAQKKDELCEYYNNTRKNKITKKGQATVTKILSEPMHNEEAIEVCGKDRLCPYEVLLEAGRKADVIVCDYFHIFSNSVRKAFLAKLGKTLEDSILIVDEAHNLPDRIRSIMSHKLSTYSLERASKEAKTLNFRQLSEDYMTLSRVLKGLARKIRPYEERYVERRELMDEMLKSVKVDYDEFTADVEALGLEVLKIPGRYRSHSTNIARFLEKWKDPDLGFTRIMQKDDKSVTVSHRCLDPSLSSAEVFNGAYSSILMSGTLTPLPMYSNILGLNSERVMERAYRSPFPKENRLTLLVPGLTTKYASRSEFMYDKYARTITLLLAQIPGNAAVFYPSYQLLKVIGSRVKTGKEIVAENQDMGKDDRRRLFDKLTQLTGGGVLMAVQAGSFSEGLDFPDNLLDAVIIVGLPLEKPNLETQALIDYYDFKFERGWDYGYIYPATNRALQAAGRCIRSETDRGAIVLLDDRFKWANYRKCFPTDFEFIVTETPEKYLKRFFGVEERLILADRLVAGSKLKEADVDGLDHKIKAEIARHYSK